VRLTGEAATKMWLVSNAADTVQRVGFILSLEKGWLMVHEMGDELLREGARGAWVTVLIRIQTGHHMILFLHKP